MSVAQLLFGMATYIPGVYRLFSRTGGTDSARYCYSVWLRHLVMAHKHGLASGPPGVVAELGPGDSLGIGLAALISGVNAYHAFDIIKLANNEGNLEIFDELVSLFDSRAAIPDDDEFPHVKPYLESYEFPSDILGDDHLARALDRSRIESIRGALASLGRGSAQQAGCISYVAPWHAPDLVIESSVDMLYSQAVLEHVDDLPFTYQASSRWLKPGAFVSHQIDFKCHNTAREWNGHWAYSRRVWKLIRGNRPYLINREPHSTHVRLLKENGFDLVCDMTVKSPSGIGREQLALEFETFSEDDLTTSGAFIQAVKKPR